MKEKKKDIAIIKKEYNCHNTPEICNNIGNINQEHRFGREDIMKTYSAYEWHEYRDVRAIQVAPVS